jgi:alanine-synthesizing transaminase
MFSSRLPAALAPNAISQARTSLQARGVRLIDLTETNPTTIGLEYPVDVLAPLSDGESRTYAPESLGIAAAREAVARDYARSGAAVRPDQVMLTASTSEAYALLFKLLCDPDDEVLVPEPSYPLFELLTRLEGVHARPYHLDVRGHWSIDRPSVEHALTDRTRAILVVSPNNPTGSFLRRADREWLVELAAARGLALVSDEVFADYPLRPRADASSLLAESRALTFTLGGLSKSAGLPQVKLGWIVISGPPDRAQAALERLALIGDAYLSVSTPVQRAAPALIASGAAIRAQIQNRLEQNLSCLERLVSAHPAVSLLAPEGGWSAVLRFPAIESEESLVVRLLNNAHVIAHPGFFFDFASEAYLVVSLLPKPEQFAQGIKTILDHLATGN